MEEEHIFIASGDACPSCQALDGSTVPAGFKAHENCLCRTLPKKSKHKHPKQKSECDSDTANIDFTPGGADGKHVIASYEVTVECPYGGSAGASGFVDVDPVVDNPIEKLNDAIAELIDDLCESCPDDDGEGDEPPLVS